MVGIYKIENLVNGKVYIGQSMDIEKRWIGHRNGKCLIKLAIQKYGIENIKFSVVEECLIEELNNKETYWIETESSMCPNGYNMRSGGGQGHYCSDETKHKITLTKTGVKLSDEHKANISKALQSIIITPWNKGLTFSQEQKEIIYSTRIGRNLSEKELNDRRMKPPWNKGVEYTLEQKKV